MKSKKIILIVLLFLCSLTKSIADDNDTLYNNENSQNESNVPRRNFQDPTKPQKALLFDGGYGIDGASFAFGYRFWNITASIGVSGLAVKAPPYSFDRPAGITFDPYGDMPTGYSRTRVGGNAVFVDAGYYLDYLETLNFFIIVGFYAQNNTILALQNSSGSYYYVGTTRNSGYTMGGGMELKLSDWVRLAGGYHSKRGFFLRLAYTWR